MSLHFSCICAFSYWASFAFAGFDLTVEQHMVVRLFPTLVFCRIIGSSYIIPIIHLFSWKQVFLQQEVGRLTTEFTFTDWCLQGRQIGPRVFSLLAAIRYNQVSHLARAVDSIVAVPTGCNNSCIPMIDVVWAL